MSSSETSQGPAVPPDLGGSSLPPNDGSTPSRSIGELVAGVTERFSRLIRDELALAQLQAKQKVTKLGMGAGLLAAAGVLALYALGILLLAAVWGIAEALPLWLSALIVGVVLLIICAILALLGKKKMDASKEHVIDPKSGIANDIEAAKKGFASNE
ncbi:MAG: phage holin family protein [Flaviflexus sp.]|nr:phage holin family protein [Flaviflexus sp.]